MHSFKMRVFSGMEKSDDHPLISTHGNTCAQYTYMYISYQSNIKVVKDTYFKVGGYIYCICYYVIKHSVNYKGQ